ncbi:hypothetical protein M426DRAFT_215979 [Hypoxylon sp. CI-4A]|nr:hypothetical protein M426DRAFT_215979 [Hypoxylon sp. CI-4A]
MEDFSCTKWRLKNVPEQHLDITPHWLARRLANRIRGGRAAEKGPRRKGVMYLTAASYDLVDLDVCMTWVGYLLFCGFFLQISSVCMIYDCKSQYPPNVFRVKSLLYCTLFFIFFSDIVSILLSSEKAVHADSSTKRILTGAEL